MTTKSAIVAVVLLFCSTLPLTTLTSSENASELEASSSTFFDGFFVGHNEDVWNATPWPTIAVPEGFTYNSVIDYSDVGVLINNLSDESRTIGWAFVAARNISLDRVFIFNESGTPTKETINRDQFETYFATPFLEMLQNRSSASGVNYLVTTKGIPLRVSGGNDKASFDQELALLGGAYNSSIGGNYWIQHDYGPLAGKAMEPFKRSKYGFFLVTRLTGYTVDTALELIERANQSLGQRGEFVLDLATNRNGSGYKFWNDDLYTANTTLNGSMGLPVTFDEESEFLTNVSNVMGYASWGSNDGNWNKNYLPNGGFDTTDSSWQSGSRYWNSSAPTVAVGDSFSWAYQTSTKQGGNGAFEAAIGTACQQDSGDMMQGVYAEYFDNAGVSFSTASMPLLIDRTPDHVRIEPHLSHGSSNNPYSGLDNRFKEDWGARFSGLIDVPDSGNWTFYLNSDDGSELWMNGASLIQNYGSHGMREYSAVVNLSSGMHDFRIEFFQGGGPHGLILSWEGPNTSKSSIPASAFYVANNDLPEVDALIHSWQFEEATGSQANDSMANGSNFTLNGMDNSNWRSCLDGSCLWFDGSNDYAQVNVDDWVGNFTVSQWVWANTTNQSAYASTFAIDDNAGSNQSFQHMVSGGKWYLHNNQSRSFGDVIAQRWTHLVTVYDSGETRQYMDGVLVNTNTYPNGSFNNIDLYKLGVNRAGSSFFEGKIDNLLIWDRAIDNSSITSLRRSIVDNCSTYSGHGTDVASLETEYPIPSNFTSHAWVIYGYGKRAGDVYGAFDIVVDALDVNGNVLSSNTSASEAFTTSWASETMRFRPHADAVTLRVTFSVDIVPTSTGGSLFVDSAVLRVIRPHMDWVNGSIADTAVSTGGRSFNWGTAYGQSLIADLLEDGVSGVKGYVYEPYLTAVGMPSILHPSYASGYNLAESHAAANRISGWMGVVVGDPKMAAYADIFHDVNIVDVRSDGYVNQGENTTIQVMFENLGMAEANGTLIAQTVQGNTILNQTSIYLPAGDQVGSRAIINLTIVPVDSGYLDLRIRYVNASPEQDFSNNLQSMTLIVNAPPTLLDAYCSASSISRGAYTICTIEATDDTNVTAAQLEWQLLSGNESLNESHWNMLQMGDIGQDKWETSLVVPSNSTLGNITLRATVVDLQGMSVTRLFANVSRVVDAPAEWFGPHASGVDDTAWNKASQLPNRPNQGLYRHLDSMLTACVQDADYNVDQPLPLMLSSRGSISNVSYAPQTVPNLYCYTAQFSLEEGSGLEDVEFQVRTTDGSLLLQRTLRVNDRSPVLSMHLEDSDGTPLDRVVGNGNEYVVIGVSDIDDPQTAFVGDLSVQWPGGQSIQLPLDIQVGQSRAVIQLNQVVSTLEAGELALQVNGIGQNAATASASLTLPFILTPPDVRFIEACDAYGPVEAMTFGQTATLLVGVTSDRPLASVTAQLTQIGWAVSAPSVETPVWDEADIPEACNTSSHGEDVIWFMFRLKLDNSLTDGEGNVLVSVRDVEGLVKSVTIDMMFQHAPTFIENVETSSAVPLEDLYLNATITDLDGLHRVTCSFQLYDQSGVLLTQSVKTAGEDTQFSNTLLWQYPIPGALANSTLAANITCVDELQASFQHQEEFDVGPLDACITCNTTGQDSQVETTATGGESFLPVFIVFMVLIVIASMVIVRRQNNRGRAFDSEWGEHEGVEDHSIEDLFNLNEEDDALPAPSNDTMPEYIPEGWTLEQYRTWMEGPCPEGWGEEQWLDYVETHTQLLDEHNASTQE